MNATDLDGYGVVVVDGVKYVIDNVKYVIDNVNLKACDNNKTLIPFLIDEIRNLRQSVDELRERIETDKVWRLFLASVDVGSYGLYKPDECRQICMLCRNGVDCFNDSKNVKSKNEATKIVDVMDDKQTPTANQNLATMLNMYEV